MKKKENICEVVYAIRAIGEGVVVFKFSDYSKFISRLNEGTTYRVKHRERKLVYFIVYWRVQKAPDQDFKLTFIKSISVQKYFFLFTTHEFLGLANVKTNLKL